MSLTVVDRSRFNGGHVADQDGGPSIVRIAEVAVPKVLPDDTEMILSGILIEPNPYRTQSLPRVRGHVPR